MIFGLLSCLFLEDFVKLKLELFGNKIIIRNKRMMIDLGTGNNNKLNWALTNKQEMIDILEVIYRGAKKGKGLVISPKDYSTKYKY